MTRRALVLILIAAALAALGWLLAPSRPPNVVLITVDTLRADRLGCYGSRTARTPAIDRLAAEGLVFDRAVAPLPETRPSHYTLFSSLHPRDHGVLSNASGFVAGHLTLPALYRAAGYATGGFPACSLFDAAAGEALGFSYFAAADEPELAAHEVVPAALDWLAGLDSEEPFFLWLHLFDPHMPYEPPPLYDADPKYNGDPTSGESAVKLPRISWDDVREIAGRHGGDLPRPVLERARALYDGEVEYVDHWLGRFFDALRDGERFDERLFDNTVTLLTSDHGECFENGVFFEHSHCLGEGAIAAPLILRFPEAVAPGRSDTPVEHLDVAPTLLRLSGLPVPESFGGRGLLQRDAAEEPYVFFQYPVYPRWEASQRRQWFGDLASVAGEPTRPIVGDRMRIGGRRGPWKYILDGSEETLFDLAADPEERVDVASRHPEELAELRGAVRLFMVEHPIELGSTGDVDPQLLEQLRALGYLGE